MFFFTAPVGQGLKLRKELCVFGKLSGMPAISCASCHSLSIFNHLQAVDTQISQISDTSDNFIGHVMSGVGTAKHWRVCFGIFGGDISPSIGWGWESARFPERSPSGRSSLRFKARPSKTGNRDL